MKKGFSLGRLIFGIGRKSNYALVCLFAAIAALVFVFADGSTSGAIMAMTLPLAGFTAEEQKLLEAVQKQQEELTSQYKKIAEEAVKGLMSKEDVDKKLEEIEKKANELPEDQLKRFTDMIDKANAQIKSDLDSARAEIKKLQEEKDEPKGPTKTGFGTLFREALKKEGLLEEYVVDKVSGKKAFAMKGYDRKDVKHSLKAAIDMTTALTLTPGSSPGTSIGYLTDYKMRDVMIDLSKDTHVTQFLPTDPISDKYMGVLIEYDYTDGTGTKDEGSASSKSSIKFKTEEFKVFTIATHFRISKENLADIDRLESKLNRIAPDRILSKLDEKVLSAAGDNSSDIKGMYVAGNYTAFTAATFASSVEDANIIDLIRKMKLQAHNNDQDVNAVILHPTQIDEIEGLKDADKNYLKSRGIVYDAAGNLIRVHGLAVLRNKKPTTSKVTVMWNEAAELGLREDINFEVGLDGNDLTEGMRTIVFEMRAAFGVGKPSSIIVSTDPTSDIGVINKANA